MAAVTRALLEIPTIAARLAALLGTPSLSDADMQRLVAIAALHDLGKANAGFQRRRAGHVQPLVSLFSGRDNRLLTTLVNQGGLAAIEHLFYADKGHQPWRAALAHHGCLPPPDAVLTELWSASGGYDPIAACKALVDAVLQWCPAASDGVSPPWTHPFGHAFAGLLTLADWFGSDESIFLVGGLEGTGRYEWALQEARKLVAARGLTPEAPRADVAALPWSCAGLTGFPEPTRMQEAVLALPSAPSGRTCLIEGETGSGKTEAALLHFLSLFRAGEVDGMYFALPTRAAAVQVHRRIERMLKGLLLSAPPIVLAVPGYLAAGDGMLPVPTPDAMDDRAEALRAAAWSGERPKRYLASWVAVGTVDQVLLGGVQVRHATLRSAAMLRLLLVMDEVHANDGYMTALLRNVLAQHRRAGGHALLMSATLGSAARTRLLTPTGSVPPPDAAAAVAVPYPAIWSDGLPGVPVWLDRILPEAKAVEVVLEPDLRDDGAIVAHAVSAARSGARVLVIRNMVRAAVPTFLALEAQVPDLLMAVPGAGGPMHAPHHARFAPEDRRALDVALEAALGKEAVRNGGRIVCATQTAEQSLDIDADLLITDLCPADVLLQRIGRLHRHRRPRPPGFEAARCIVLAPSPDDLAATLKPDGDVSGAKLALGLVYPDLLGILATRAELARKGTLSIPADNRRLVEAATHPVALEGLARESGGRWLKRWEWQTGTTGATAMAAAHAGLAWEKPIEAFASNETITVRLGLDDRSIELPSGTVGPFGCVVSRLSVSGRWLGGVALDAELTIKRPEQGTLTICLAGKAFRYDRLGLRPL